MSMMPNDASLLASVVAKMTEYKSIVEEENGGYGLYSRAVSINLGAFAFLTVPPTLTGPGNPCMPPRMAARRP
jgi:hypothetical protein